MDHVVADTKKWEQSEAAGRWVSAVNADGQLGRWRHAMARSVASVREILDDLAVTSA